MRIGGMDMKLRFVRPGAAAVPPSTLLDGLVSYWLLDEESGTRVDSVGDNDLTDNNTVGSAAGKIDNAASFVSANGEYLSVNNNATVQVGTGSFTWSFWTLLADADGSALLDKGPQSDYTVDISGGTIRFYTANGGGYPIASSAVPTLDAWHLITAWRDSSVEKLFLQIDNGTPSEQATGAIVASDTASRVTLGSYANGASIIDGRLDEVAFWSRVLTADERTALYNSGDGVTHPFTGISLP